MDKIQTILKRVDHFQQKHPVVAFPVAVVKRYGEDKTGHLAALVTYYAFLSIFPLLLVFVTVVGIVIQNNPELQAKVIGQVLQYFPALGDSLKTSVQEIKGTGIILILELMVLFYGARGFAAILQESFNSVWHADPTQNSSFIKSNLRSLGMMASVGLGIIVGTVISFSAASIFDFGFIGTALVTLLNLVFSFGLFLVVFRLGTSSAISLKSLMAGALMATIGSIIVQHAGGYIMSYQLPKLQSSYGSFAFALGMLFWIYFQAQVILYALEATAVKVQRDWPKKLLD